MPYKNPEDAKARTRRYYLAHKEKILKQTREWALAHPEKRKEISARDNRKRREKKRIWWENKSFGGAISIIGENKCWDCGEINDLVIHHLDGNHSNNEIKNLKIICKKCHAYVHGKKRGGLNRKKDKSSD